MKLCSGQAQEALMHLATQTQPLSTSLCEPEEQTHQTPFFLVWCCQIPLSSPAWPAASAEFGPSWNGSYLPCWATSAANSCSAGWSFGIRESSCKSVKISVQQWRQTLVSKQRLLAKQVFPANQVLIQTMPGFLFPYSSGRKILMERTTHGWCVLCECLILSTLSAPWPMDQDGCAHTCVC